MVQRRWTPTSGLAAALLLCAACGGDRKPSGGALDAGSEAGVDAAASMLLSREELLDPMTCKGCHPRHYREWASSMHAYAAKDPVFLAMNKRGQRETDGELGDFCVGCHAPMAVREGATQDGLNLDEVPEHLQGVTCYFCHNAIDTEAPHNGQVVLANDQTMRGSIRDPRDPKVHGVAYSEAHDRNTLKSSELCGSCHDVVTPKGVHLERTYAEYLKSNFAKADKRQGFDSCQGCHMDTTLPAQPIAVVPGMELPDRPIHEHLWPAVDVALTDDFPDQDVQELAVLCALANGTSLTEFTANDFGNEFTITLETDAGHGQPSGAAQDRRLWIEFVAYDDAGEVIFESGRPAAGEPLDPAKDPYLTVYRDHIYDELGREVHMFWEAAPSEMWPLGYESNVLPFATTPLEPHYKQRKFTLSVRPARVEARLMIQPVGLDILQKLVDSGDLDEQVVRRMPSFPLYGTAVEWTREQGAEPITVPKRPPIRCPDDYLELLAK